MECNKEEAVRAKGIAEKRMQGMDFIGAQKIVLKAKQLFPDLENISQMLTVCEVHSSAGIKVNGETDWYAILQVEPTADEPTIKKQYRKLALLLHPDKNKFIGAEAAFKLVGEAHRTLSDQVKRSLHDMKRGANFRTIPLRQPTHQPNRSPGTRKHGVSKNATTTSSTQHNGPSQQQSSQSSGANTFWTMCPFCSIKYQYYQSILNKALRCSTCMNPFIAYDVNIQAAPSGANPGYSSNHTRIPKQDVRGHGAHVAGQKSYCGNAVSGMGFQGNVGGGSTSSKPGSKSGFNTEFADGSKNKPAGERKMDRGVRRGNEVQSEKVRLHKVNKREQVAKPSAGNSRQKRGRKVDVEPSDSENSDSDVVIEEDTHFARQNVGSNPRRSTRQKQNILYNEDRNDGANDYDTSTPVKRSRKGGSKNNGDQKDNASFEGYSNGVDIRSNGGKKRKRGEESLRNGLQRREQETGDREQKLNPAANSKDNPCVGSSQKTSGDMESATYPDPEFFDFEKERDSSKFAVDQIWALYDDSDGMPRYYAHIKYVHVPNFKVRFTWLETDPVGRAEKEWVEEDLPVACGNFRLGKVQTTKEVRMFSHLMSWRKGNKKNHYQIYPQKGEVWAVFKDWDIGWSTDADNHRVYEFELVEALSDYTVTAGITVANLVKITGFVSLFMRAVDESPLDIPPTEILRFSHMVPSYRMTREEREGILAGSFELDAVALPINLECFRSVSLASSKVRVHNLDNEKQNSFQLNENGEKKQESRDPSPNWQNGACQKEYNQASREQHSASEAGKCVETETSQQQETSNAAEQDGASPMSYPIHFYEYPEPEFSNFQESRSSDKFKCGQIWALYNDVSRYPNYYGRITKVDSGEFNVHLTWLQAYTMRKEEKRWLNEMPVSCGTFEITSETAIFDANDAFSHLVQVVPAGRKDHYAIYPNTGEVWALCRDWSLEWSRSDLEDCKYDMVEILARNDSGIRVLFLRKVSGYTSVFMPGEGPGSSTVQIPVTEYLRFSHQIPASRLTEEAAGGKLRGYWELDPASVPEILLVVD